MTKNFRDATLSPILEDRMNGSKPTVITSNLKMENLSEYFTTYDRSEVEITKANRLVDRVRVLTTPVLMNGKNYRIN
jgi:primosomal protein DnaI